MHILPPDTMLINESAIRLLRLLRHRREPLFEEAATALGLDGNGMWELLRGVSYGPNWLCERFRCRRCRFDARLRLLPQGESLLAVLDAEQAEECNALTLWPAAPAQLV